MNLSPEVKSGMEAHLLNCEDPSVEEIVNLAVTLERTSVPVQLSAAASYVAHIERRASQIDQQCDKCNRKGYSSEKCWTKTTKCFACGELGHIASSNLCKNSRGGGDYRLRVPETRAAARQELYSRDSSAAQQCAFCGEIGNYMAQCRAFLHLVHKYNFCGAIDHESHLCTRKSETKEQQTSGKELTLGINHVMQTEEDKSDGKAYFVTITLDAMIDNGVAVCLISDSVI